MRPGIGVDRKSDQGLPNPIKALSEDPAAAKVPAVSLLNHGELGPYLEDNPDSSRRIQGELRNVTLLSNTTRQESPGGGTGMRRSKGDTQIRRKSVGIGPGV